MKNERWLFLERFDANKYRYWHEGAPEEVEKAIDLTGWMCQQLLKDAFHPSVREKLEFVLSRMNESEQNQNPQKTLWIELQQLALETQKVSEAINSVFSGDLNLLEGVHPRENIASGVTTALPSRQAYILSPELLDGLDNLDVLWMKDLLEGWTNNIEKIPFLNIGFQFREVFLKEQNQPLPAHYREGIDIVVDNIEDARKEVGKFSYQVARAMFYKFAPKSGKMQRPSLTDEKIRKYYSAKSACQKYNDQISLKDLQYVRQPVEIAMNEACTSSEVLVLACGPEVSIDDMCYTHSWCAKELLLILQGEHYQDIEIRKQVLDKALGLFSDSTKLVHVILLTEKNANCELIDLKPDLTAEQEGFSPLANHVGYYLSDERLFERSYRNWQSTYKIQNFVVPKIPEKRMVPVFIISNQVGSDFRHTKVLNRKALKARAKLAMTQQINLQQSLAENTTVNQDQELSQSQELSQTQLQSMAQRQNKDLSQSYQGGYCWWPQCDLSEFSNQLKVHADKLLATGKRFGSTHHHYQTKQHFYKQLAVDELFRTKIVARIFMKGCIVNGKSWQLVSLPKYSLDYINYQHVDWMIARFPMLVDGLNLKSHAFKFKQLIGVGGRVLDSICSTDEYVTSDERGIADDIGKKHWQGSHRYYVLLTHESLAGLSPEDKAIQIKRAETLLSYLDPVNPWTSSDISRLEAEFVELVRFYFPDNPECVQIIDEFIQSFEEHTLDNLRILLMVAVSGHRNNMEAFIKLLEIYQSHGILSYFYSIYFKYADNIFSVGIFLSLERRLLFNRLANESWPACKTFCLHTLVWFAKHNMTAWSKNDVETCWRNLFTKCLIYTGDQEKAKALMEQMVNTLTQDEGLAFEGMCSPTLYFDGLETLFDRAIENHTLHEQLSELRGLYLGPLDATYALVNNGFKVVCQEMELHSEVLNPVTGRYSVTAGELQQTLLKQYKPDVGSMKTTLFRYLGTQTLREDLAWYRQVYAQFCKGDDLWLKELVLGYFVLKTTGLDYRSSIDKEQFMADFLTFVNPVADEYLQQFFEIYDKTPRDEQKGSTSLWTLCQVEKHLIKRDAPIPEILTKKFDEKNLVKFLLFQQEQIINALPSLQQDQDMAKRLLRIVMDEYCKPLKVKTAMPNQLILQLYPELDMRLLLQNFVKINAFVEQYAQVSKEYSGTQLFIGFKHLFERTKSIDSGLVLIELLSRPAVIDMALAKRFLNSVAEHKGILANADKAKSMLAAVVDYYFSDAPKNIMLNVLLRPVETLMTLDEDKALKAYNVILDCMKTDQGYQFFSQYASLDAVQLLHIATLIHDYDCPLSLIEADLDNLEALVKQFQNMPPQHIKPAARILERIANRGVPVSIYMNLLQNIPAKTLVQLESLIDLHSIKLEDIERMVRSPFVPEAVAAYERFLYARDTSRFKKENNINEKIAQIRYKSPEGDELPLDEQLQEQLQKDYLIVMSYLSEKPVLEAIDEQGTRQRLTVHELNEEQFQIVFASLKTRIRSKQQVHQNQLMLVALASEAIYRTTGKFPRYPQLLSVLNTLNQKGNLIHEIRTGEGKSIIAALHGILESGADLVTENNQLAMDGLNKFKRFYDYLGVHRANTIVEAHGHRRDYVANGIDHATASGLALFREQMSLGGHTIPDGLLCMDEVDAALTSTVQFRLAASLNPLLHDTQSWSLIYNALVNFVEDKEKFRDNKCSPIDDITNFRNYVLVSHQDKRLAELIRRIPSELFSNLIDSALIANELEEGIDFLVLPCEKNCYYAAPILGNTKRPDARVNWSEGVQQLVHARLSTKQRPFKVEPASETLIVISIKNFIDQYRLNGRRTVGFTGTGGSLVERREFNDETDLRVFSYPAFHPDGCVDLKIEAVHGITGQFQAVLNLLKRYGVNTPDHEPILIFHDSPKHVELLNRYLREHLPDAPIQVYVGDKAGQAEERIIHKAEHQGMITTATESLARGADFKTRHLDGSIGINLCTNLTESDLLQMRGRVGRNGKPGKFCSIIDLELLGPETSHIESIEERFKAHQQGISRQQQRERLKTRLLEEVSYYMTRQLLALRNKADHILNRQNGMGVSLVALPDFLIVLRDFNINAEKHYMDLLGEQDKLDERQVDVFIQARVEEYQQALLTWLPENKFERFETIEPRVEVENLQSLSDLNSLTVRDLSIISELLSKAWTKAGHKNMREFWQGAAQLQESFEPWFKKQKGFKNSLILMLQSRGLLEKDVVLEKISVAKQQIISFVDNAKSSFCKDLLANIPGTNWIDLTWVFPDESIKQFIAAYATETRQHVELENWDALTLPRIDNTAVAVWFGRLQTTISTVSTVTGYASVLTAGPIPFIVNRIIMPTLKPIVERLLVDSGSVYGKVAAGLSSMTTDLTRALMFMTSIPDTSKVTVGQVLDNLMPLLLNPAFMVGAGYWLEQKGYSDYVIYLRALPDYVKAFENDRDHLLSDVLTGERLTGLFLQVCQLDVVKQVLKDLDFEETAAQIAQLPSNFVTTFKPLSIKQVLGFAKVMAHPEFCKCLKGLPEQITFEQLNLWLEAEPDSVPEEGQEAMIKFRDYQTNLKIIEDSANESLRTLKYKYNLTEHDIKSHLKQLKPVKPVKAVEPETPVAEGYKIPWQKVFTGLIWVGIVAINVVMFSIPLLATSMLLAATMMYRYVTQPKPHVPEPIIIENVPEPEVQPVCINTVSDDEPTRQSKLKPRRDNAVSPVTETLGRVGLFGSSASTEKPAKSSNPEQKPS